MRASRLLLPIIYLGFVSLGLPDGTLGVAWPAMYPALDASIGLAGTLLIVVTLLSALSGFCSGRVVARFQTGPVVAASGLLTGGALWAFASAPAPWMLFLAAVPLGLGAGSVDAGLNGFVARHYSGKHMNWLHACWGLGATGGPLLMGWALAGPAGWRGGYLLIGSLQLALALVFFSTLSLWARAPSRRPGDEAPDNPAKNNDAESGATAGLAADSPAGWLAPVIFGLYVAAETTVGLWAASVLEVGRGHAPSAAAVCVAFYYGSITAGRVLTGFVVDAWGARRLVTGGLLVAAAGLLLFAGANTAALAGLGLTLVGLGFAPVYPCLMHETPRRFSPAATQVVIGRQSGAAYVGAATLPALSGWVATHSLAAIPWVALACVGALWATIRRLDGLSRRNRPV